MELDEDAKFYWFIGKCVAAFIISLILIFAIVVPMMKPWWAGQSGKAELAQADQNRQITIVEATAKREAAIQLAQAEIERAKGVAQANKIIGESLQENEDYLRYLWITDVAGANIDKTVVYVPTETNLPILEASRQGWTASGTD